MMEDETNVGRELSSSSNASSRLLLVFGKCYAGVAHCVWGSFFVTIYVRVDNVSRWQVSSPVQ